MSNKKLNEQEELFIDLDDRGSDNSISEKIKDLNSAGKLKINLEIKSSFEIGIKNLELDTDLFKKIKKIQNIPDWVIIKLILAAGKLKSSNLKERILNG